MQFLWRFQIIVGHDVSRLFGAFRGDSIRFEVICVCSGRIEVEVF